MRSLRLLGLLIVFVSLSALSVRADISYCQANGLYIGSVANKPFTAEVRIATWQFNSSDREDMHIVRIMEVARDSSGRVMVLFPQRWASDEARETGGQPIKWQTMICDPTGLDTTVTAKQTANAKLTDTSSTGSASVEAWVTVQPVLPRRTVSEPYPFDGPHMSPENFKVEDLGVGAIGGISAHRFRWWGRADGEAPNGNYVEQAFSEDLQLVVAGIEVKDNIARGTVYVHLDRGEPDPGLFLIPINYKIISTKELPPAK